MRLLEEDRCAQDGIRIAATGSDATKRTRAGANDVRRDANRRAVRPVARLLSLPLPDPAEPTRYCGCSRSASRSPLALDASTLFAGLAAGIASGALGAWLMLRARHESEQREARSRWEATRDALDTSRDESARHEERARRVPELETRLAEREGEVTTLRVDSARLHAELKAAAERLLAERKAADDRLLAEQQRAADRLAVLEHAQATMAERFRAVASETLEASTRKLQEQSQAGLATLLDPLRQRLADFQKKVEDVYVDESKERSALREHLESLKRLNQALSDDARQLTAALRGSVKQQGNWGELILERVLEASGLRRGHEYEVQDTQRGEDGQRLQPDVVIHLPESRRLVVDAKVSLIAYERYAIADDDTREAALREHLNSVRAHLRGLSDKRYQTLYGNSLDFVLMFVPIEPAFMAAVTHDQQLFTDAWERNVLLVSPSTLLFVVRTVAHLWRQEAQTRNAQEIARRGAELYDRLAGFATDLESVGQRLDGAHKAWTDARRKLSEGRGNVIRQAEMLRELGVKPSRRLPAALVEAAADDAENAAGGPPPESGDHAPAAVQPPPDPKEHA
jgi:DNA recombination protein RmuC